MKNKLWKKFKKWAWDDADYPKDQILSMGITFLAILGVFLTIVIRFWEIFLNKVFN